MPTETTQIQPAWLNAQCPREGRYVLGPLLGRGGVGHVHEAWDVVLCRTVALKILKHIDPPALMRFMHEAQIHARLVHPNICRIYDVDNHDGALRVAMQLVRGESLEQAYPALTQAQVVTIMALVAQAVHVVHRLHLVHRDLKPSNILLERDAEGTWVPFVCDFGLVMALDEPAFTFSHLVMGTPAYMAPEQFRGERRQISASTDVYALGGSLYFALTGHLPAGPTGTHAAAAEDPRLPRELKAIIARCMQEDPKARYPTASALAEDLRRFRAGEPVQATRPRHLDGLRRHLARPGRIPMALAALLLPLLGWQALLFDWRQDSRQVCLAQCLLQEAGTAAADLRLEQTLPVHDLRPSYTRLRLQMEHQRKPLASLARPWQGQGHTVRGTMAYLVGDYPVAQAELEQAAAAGCQQLEDACCMAQAAIGQTAKTDRETQFRTGKSPTGPDPRVQRALALLDQIRDSHNEADEYANALAAFMERDYLRAAAASHSSALATPWRSQAAVLEADSLAALARQDLEAGNAVAAHDRLTQAMAAAKRALATAQSDPAAHHAYFQAARGLVTLEQAMGSPSLPWLGQLQTASDLALVLDPENPKLQDDWLAFRWLQALQILDQGGNPGPVLDEAQAFLATRAREPLPPELLADRMILYWLRAERHLRQGGDPGPDLAQAMKRAGHTPFLLRDYFEDVEQMRIRLQAGQRQRPAPARARACAQRNLAMAV
jgi:serine/threonine-protein kinase